MAAEKTKHLIYGEMEFNSLSKIYNLPVLKSMLKNFSTFCNLGSGTGRIVVGMALLLPFLKKYTGIEILNELYEESNSIFANICTNN